MLSAIVSRKMCVLKSWRQKAPTVSDDTPVIAFEGLSMGAIPHLRVGNSYLLISLFRIKG